MRGWEDADIKMLSLTNPFRKPFVTGTQPQVPVSPSEQTTSSQAAPSPTSVKTPCVPRPDEHQLSSLLGACEAGTHAFSHEDFGGQGSWGGDAFRRSGASFVLPHSIVQAKDIYRRTVDLCRVQQRERGGGCAGGCADGLDGMADQQDRERTL